jgi:cytochrome c nitrite reductase small subunit
MATHNERSARHGWGWTVLAVLVGLLAGMGGFTFLYAEGFSYLSSDPKACVNCHIMQPQFDAWQKASHHAVAGCVDCHLPHDFVGKWLAKGENGYRHSKAFTFQDFHEPIVMTTRNRRILEESCLHCHAGLVHDMLAATEPDSVRCVHCHRAVGHGPTTGLGRDDRR